MYNKTLMDECGIDKVPTTYDELKDAAVKAKAKGYVCVAAGAADDWVNSDWLFRHPMNLKMVLYMKQKLEKEMDGSVFCRYHECMEKNVYRWNF